MIKKSILFLIIYSSFSITPAYSHELPEKYDQNGHIIHHGHLSMTKSQQLYYKKSAASLLDFIEQFREKNTKQSYKHFLEQINNTLVFSYSHPYRNREFCNVFTVCRDDYVGIKLADMNVQQQNKFNELMQALLAPYGYQKMVKVFARQPILFDIESAFRDNPEKFPVEGGPRGTPQENWQPFDKKGNPFPRNQDDYYIAFFGDLEKFINRTIPKNEGFGIRVEGHHLSLNFTFINQNGHLVISTSPTFYGSNPMVVPPAPSSSPEKYKYWRLTVGNSFMLSETQIAKRFINSLSTAEKAASVYPKMGSPLLESAATQKPMDTENFKQFSEGSLSGIKLSDLKGSQDEVTQKKYLFIELIKLLVGTQRKEALNLKDIIDDMDNMRIAFYGETGKFDAFYFRVQSKKFLLELVQSTHFSVKNPGNIHNKKDPKNNGLYNNNHVHIMFRDLRNDWGLDPLQLHEYYDHH